MFKPKFKIAGLLAVVVFAVLAAFSGCLKAADYEKMYDDDAQIANYSSNMRVGAVEQDLLHSYQFSCISLSGVYTMVNMFTVDENSAADLSLDVRSGECKVVLVSKSKEVFTLAEGSFDGALDLPPEYGNYKLKIVGVSAEFTLTLNY